MSQFNEKPLMDPELKAAMGKLYFPALSHLSSEVIKTMRTVTATPSSYLDDQKVRGISHREVHLSSSHGGDHQVILSILESASESKKIRPCIYWIHGGGFHWGDRLHTLEFPTELILDCDAVCVSVEYRLAPEHSYSEALEDCYQGLEWVSEHAQELDIDLSRLMLGGASAGGGLAASTALLCRDRQGPVLCAQCLICPALDDRLITVSSQQYVEDSDFLPYALFKDMWKSILGNNQEDTDSGIILPGRLENLSALPTTYLDAGSAELLRDETVAYASRLWANGVQTELHIWAGGFHGFDIFFSDAAVSQASRKAKSAWARRTFKIES
jgi:acetyl esterase/lipase